MQGPPKASVEEAKHFAWLDWMRFLAAFVVLVGHARFQHFSYYQHLSIPGKGKLTEAVFLLPRFANEAVMIFFVLSGFLVGGRCIERIKAGTFDAKRYALDRATRIWIPLIPTVVLTWGVEWIRTGSISLWEGIGNILSLQGVMVKPMANNLSLWSLSYETWFYTLALGVALILTPRTAGEKLWGLLIAAASMAVFIPLEAGYLFVWIVGALAYTLPRDSSRKSWLVGGGILAAIGLVLSALGTSFTSIDISWLSKHLPPREIAIIILGLGISLALPMIVACYPRKVFARWLESWGTRLAASSYSLYLVHRPILELWTHLEGGETHNRVDSQSLFLFVGKLAVCLLGGWLFYLAFEKHTASVRKFLTAPPRKSGSKTTSS